MKSLISRRQFMTGLAATAVGSVYLPRMAWSASGSEPVIYVVHGSDPGRMLAAGIGRMGGWAGFVKPRQNVVLKLNAAWASLPEQGGNTSPALVECCIQECLRSGASAVVVPEKSCSNPKDSFERSGIGAAVKRAGGRMYSPERHQFQRVAIPRGVKLKEADVVRDVLEAPCLINMPVAKSHGGSTLTLSMKNWMGSVYDRGYWHAHNLHQCIADFSSFIKPSLIIVDALRILTTGGPQGPGKLAYPNQLIFGTDPVAVDAYAATLFGKQPFDVLHIKLAHDMGVGCGNLQQVRIVRVEA
ncbi:MAG: DUF362 domain-containing protein [Kiritimatiellae bacterium]|nr:DUF362 domain-containing protein [Kiritimatiellia bacterium]